MDLTQIVLVVVISVLTVLLTVISIEVFLILRELWKASKKFNDVLEDTHTVTHAIAEPVAEASELVLGLKNGLGFFGLMTRFLSDYYAKHKEDIKKTVIEKKDAIVERFDLQDKEKDLKKEIKKHFFVKSGKKLLKPH